MTDKWIEKLEALPDGTDFTDAQTFQQLLYGDGDTGDASKPVAATEGVTTKTEAPAEVKPAEPAQPEPVAKVESSESPAAAKTNDDEPVDGVLTRDGKRVIPYDVLAEARNTAKTQAARAQQMEAANRQLQEQIDALKTGKAANEPEATPQVAFSAERIAQVKTDFPEMAELMESQNRLVAELAKVKTETPQVPPAPREPEPDVSRVQALIDEQPLLAKWQAKGGIAWGRAQEVDDALRNDPAWVTKSMAERFAEVQRRVADELGVEIPTPKAAEPTPAKPAAAPAPQPEKAPAIKVVEPPTPSLSDFNGSAPATEKDQIAGLAIGQAVDKAMSMSVDDIYRLAGIQH
jgi:hypothetical protein